MDYTMLCPVCATPCTDRFEDCCSGCSSIRDPVYVCWQLVKVVELLIKRGIGVTDTDISYCTSHKTKVTIILAGNVPVQLFNELPDRWQLRCCDYYPYSRNYDLVCKTYQLYSNEIHYSKMINSLEEWLKNRDADGFKAVLRLSGYDADI